jgi:hypothetical protein
MMSISCASAGARRLVRFRPGWCGTAARSTTGPALASPQVVPSSSCQPTKLAIVVCAVTLRSYIKHSVRTRPISKRESTCGFGSYIAFSGPSRLVRWSSTAASPRCCVCGCHALLSRTVDRRLLLGRTERASKSRRLSRTGSGLSGETHGVTKSGFDQGGVTGALMARGRRRR